MIDFQQIMEVKTEIDDQSADSTTVSIMKIYMEMSEKYAKLQQEFIGLRKENAGMKKEMAELKEEMARNGQKYKRQMVTLNEDLAKLKGQSHHRELEMGQKKKKSMQQNNNFDDLPIEGAQNEFADISMMGGLNHRKQQNLDNTFDFVENVKMRTNCPFQMETTSSTTLNGEEYENSQNIGLKEEAFEVEANIAIANQNNGLVRKIELNDEQNGRSISVEKDLDEEDKLNGIIEKVINDGIDSQIKFAPIKIGNILKCSWPGCEHRTKEMSNMRMHWYTHTGERPYVCEECGQSFNHPGSLKRHKRIHTGEKPYVCTECGQSFASSRTLQSHALIHKGQKPYQCDVCGQSFRQSGHLIGHKRIHTGEKPYRCDLCGKSFRQSNILKEHKRTHVCTKNGRSRSTRNVQKYSSI